jgi:glycosyltransferase involved in cell wall biosynthesis
MIVHFFEPPSSQTTGGLDLAIQSQKALLKHLGVDVRTSSPVRELGESDGEELVHFHGIWQPQFLKISAHCRRRGIPYVVSPHGMLEPWAFKHKWWKKWPYFYLIEKRHIARAHRLVATSDAEANNLRKLFPTSKWAVLSLGLTASTQPNYLAARSALGWQDSELILLFLSRIHPKKGLHLLLAALENIGPQLSQRARLVIVGGGEPSYLRKLRRFHEKNRSRLPRIDWIGEVWSEKKWEYLQGADLFCLPSYSENFGLAVLEALQVGTRVLTTTQTPWRAIPSWNAGYVVEPTESAIGSALAEHLTRSPRWSSEQRSRLAEKIHGEFSWNVVGPRYLRLYEDIVKTSELSRRRQ